MVNQRCLICGMPGKCGCADDILVMRRALRNIAGRYFSDGLDPEFGFAPLRMESIAAELVRCEYGGVRADVLIGEVAGREGGK